MGVVRVLLVDDQAPFLRAMSAVVEETAGFEVVGEVSSGEESILAADELLPDVVLMDVNLPGIDGVEATRQLSAAAVADGLAKSARVITAGAAVMITVFLSFVLGQVVFTKMFGIGLAAAVFLDATIVRMVLVPATMELLGDRNWWLPSWLDRLLPHLRVDDDVPTDDDSAAHVPVVPATPVTAGSR